MQVIESTPISSDGTAKVKSLLINRILTVSLHYVIAGSGRMTMGGSRIGIAGACIAMALLSGCGSPDTKALKRMACEQVANTIDLQSVSQLDALRKALGLAPGVDPIASCRALGATMGGGPQPEATGQDTSNEN